MEGYIAYSDLKNGTLNLYDLYILNELIQYKMKTIEKKRIEFAVKSTLDKEKK